MGKTRIPALSSRPFGKHPHLRGENPYSGTFIPTLWETSPPAWGKLRERVLDSITAGNIPTCVGKTLSTTRAISRRWKHPHLRGENAAYRSVTKASSETSPPAWGKHIAAYWRGQSLGNIPTCVGKTLQQIITNLCPQKHPHLRGENYKADTTVSSVGETSPPAWGKLSEAEQRGMQPGNIPTCVGKTAAGSPRPGASWKHPHLRGENFSPVEELNHAPETSPPAWGKRCPDCACRVGPRNIPTCVGKTKAIDAISKNCRKHPHLRGENSKILS